MDLKTIRTRDGLVENAIGEKIQIHKAGDEIARDEILSFCQRFSEIYIYGAGNVARRMLAYIAKEGVKCTGIIVSDARRKNAFIQGIKVYEFSEIEYGDTIGIVLALSPKNQDEVMKNIETNGVPKLDNIYVQTSYAYEQYKKRMEDSHKDKGYFRDYKDLDNIGRRFNTDKSSSFHNYLKKYDFFLNKFRDKEMNVLELGVYKGASIAMWEEYFSKAIIYGVDINEECRIYNEGRKRILIEDLSYEERIKKLTDIGPEIIIDDASHLWSHQIKAVYELLPCLPSGGVYILEDLETSFGAMTDTYGDASISAYDFLSLISEVVTSGYALRLDKLNYDFYLLKDEIEYLASQIEMMSFIEGSCVIIKK